ncbi:MULTISPECIES: hypothetical protein [Enterobacter cloacae complex]|nr:hypothetical protein [Enterobacter hormaechei]VAM11577.1 Uncharacterised protein [Enterobacter hormaechei]
MIVDFHFDEDFLGCDDLTSNGSNLVNTVLLKFWFERGCLVYPSAYLENYKEWIEFVPVKYRERWLAALSTNLTNNMITGYQRINDYPSLIGLKTQYEQFGVDLVLVPQCFNNLGINDDCPNISNGFDLCKIDSFLESPSVTNSFTLSQQGIFPGDDIDLIWKRQFSKLAKHSKVITIIDRYFGVNICEDINKRKTTLEKIVSLLNDENKKYSITIFTVGDVIDSVMHTELVNYMRRFVEKPNVKKILATIKICSCPDTVFRDHAHERFISFDNFVVTIDKGTEIFRDFPLVATNISINRKVPDSNFSHALKHLQAKRLWSY